MPQCLVLCLYDVDRVCLCLYDGVHVRLEPPCPDCNVGPSCMIHNGAGWAMHDSE